MSTAAPSTHRHLAMDVTLRRPLSELLSSRSPCLLALNAASRRHESSYRRSRSRLNVKPDPSFLTKDGSRADHIIFNPPSSAPSVLNTPLKFLPKSDPRARLLELTAKKLVANSIIPLPKHLARRVTSTPLGDSLPAGLPTGAVLSPASRDALKPRIEPNLSPRRKPVTRDPYNPDGELPPRFKAKITGPKMDNEKGVLGSKEIQEMQRLRVEDRDKYTTTVLAKMFGCSVHFVEICMAAGLPADPTPRKERMAAQFKVIEDAWGPRRRKANEERERRMDAALRDE